VRLSQRGKACAKCIHKCSQAWARTVGGAQRRREVRLDAPGGAPWAHPAPLAQACDDPRMAFPQDDLVPGETLLFHMRTHWKALAGAALWAVLGLVGIVLASVFLDGDTRFVVIGVIVVAVLALAIGPTLRWLSSTYTVTDRRIITRAGFLTKTGREIPLRRVSGVSFEQGPLDRIVGCGSLFVESSAETAVVVFRDVPNVSRVQQSLSSLIGAQPT